MTGGSEEEEEEEEAELLPYEDYAQSMSMAEFLVRVKQLHADGDIGFSKEYEVCAGKKLNRGKKSFDHSFLICS